MTRRIIIGIGIILILILGYFWFFGGTSQEKAIYAKVKKGKFVIAVASSGELYAKKSVKILGPEGLRRARIWQIKIEQIIPEGTVVKKGDFIASLDRSELSGKIKDKQAELDKALSQFTQSKLDTTLELRELRDKLVNLKYDMEEKRLELQQSKFEPPATIKKVEISLQKAQRAYDQALENYQLKKNKAIAKMQEAGAVLEQAQISVDFMQELMEKFTINAPEGGMMIYQRSWDGQKRREGSTIGAWDPVVATLPDMSVMLSRTYINEVDIRKVKKGQKVKIGLDAFPEKKFTGEVISVANVGEQKPNSDAKVFEVNIEIAEKDTLLLPAMTTSNEITADIIKSTLFIPLESLHTKASKSKKAKDITYVFKKTGTGLVKQEVGIGKTNDNEVEIFAGLKEDEEVLLSKPKNPDSYRLVKLSKSQKDKLDKKSKIAKK